MKKTLCIIPHKIGLGGPASFQTRFSAVCAERGHAINHDPLDPSNSAILVIGGTKHLRSLKQAKRNGVRIIQRLNGMNWLHRKTRTGLKHYLRSEVNNWILSTIRSEADQIIYQSEFSQGWWQRVYGDTPNPGRVIYNGVDLNQYNPTGIGNPPQDRIRILIVEGHLGNGYDQGLESAAQMAKLLAQRIQKTVELMVVGCVPEALKEKVLDYEVPVIWKGVVKREQIPSLDRSAHLLFSSDINAACPNSVIEALACGLPVIGYDTGSLFELISDEGGCVASYGGDPWMLQKPDIHSLADAAQKVISNLVYYRAAARSRAVELYDIQNIADQYLEVLLQ